MNICWFDVRKQSILFILLHIIAGCYILLLLYIIVIIAY
jgi:hypothetical protein